MNESLLAGLQLPMLPTNRNEYLFFFQKSLWLRMRELGIVLAEDEKIMLSLDADNCIRVCGLTDAESVIRLEKSLNTAQETDIGNGAHAEKGMYERTFYLFSDYAMKAESFAEARDRALLIDLKNRAGCVVREQTGIDMDFSRLHVSPDGRLAGYPDDLAWIFENRYNPAPSTDDDKVQFAIAVSVKNIVERLMDAGYSDIPSLDELNVCLSFTKDDFLSGNVDLVL